MIETPQQVDARMAHQRAKEHLALVGFIHVSLVVAAAAAWFAGGELGLIAAPIAVALACVTTADLIRTGYRVIRGSRALTDPGDS